MSLVSLHDYACPACSEPYLPFAAGVTCPRCGAEPDEVQVGFLPEVEGILDLVWRTHRHWLPPVSKLSTLGDHYVWLLVGALARAGLDDVSDDDAVAAKADRAAEQIHLGAKGYLRAHYAEFFRRVFPKAARMQRTNCT